jgi:hypothetical protein
MHAIHDRITVAGPEVVGVPLTVAAYAHASARALPEVAAMAHDRCRVRMNSLQRADRGTR